MSTLITSLVCAIVTLISMVLYKIQEHNQEIKRWLKHLIEVVGFSASIITISATSIVTISNLNVIKEETHQEDVQIENNDGDGNNNVQISKSIILEWTLNNIQKNDFVGTDIRLDEEASLLKRAKEYIEKGNFKEAIQIYTRKKLINNEYSKLNMAYMYAHGCGVEQSTKTAMKIYESINSNEAKRGKLALLIVTNSKGKNDKKILLLINQLIKEKDFYTLNYVSHCKYDKNNEELTDKERKTPITMDEINKEKCVQVSYVSALQKGDVYFRFALMGATTGENKNGNIEIYYKYGVYTHQYLEWLEMIYV